MTTYRPRSNEINQSLIRLGLVILILFYYTLHEYLTQKKYFSTNSFLLLSFLAIATLEYVWALNCSVQTSSQRQKVYFRIVTNFIDNVLLAVAMIKMGVSGAPLFVIYLWVTFGIGIRYGGKYLIFSAILNIISFCSVIYISPIWASSNTLYITTGILLSLVILPAYVYILILRLASALEAEKNANKIKQSFLANMNHELRTPLNSILNLTELIRTYRLPDKIYDMLDMIRVSSNTQLQIVNSILDISKIEAGKYKLNEEKFDLYAMMDEVKRLISSHADKKGVNLYVYIDSDCKQYLVGAGDQIKQVLINLVGNAIKFTDEGFVRVSVKSVSINMNKQQVEFLVEDTGIGIAKKDQGEIFKPFNQVDTSITRKYGGTGLGVTISDELVRLMGGKLMLESTLDAGSTFMFRIFLSIPTLVNRVYPADIKVCTLNLEEKHSRIIDVYAKQAMKIISSPMQVDSIDNKTVFMVRQGEAGRISYLINTTSNPSDLIMMGASDKKCDFVCDHNVITSVSFHASEEILLNAINICKQFLPKDTNPIYGLPLTTHSLDILLVEDDKTLREIQKIIFTRTGHKLTLASNGKEALAMMYKNNYDIVILDLHIPELSGIDVALHYRKSKQANSVKLILLTADINNSQLSPDTKAMFSMILVKPIEPDDLLRKIYILFELPVTLELNLLSHINEYDEDTSDNDIDVNHVFAMRKIRLIGRESFAYLLQIYDEEIKELITKLHEMESTFDCSGIKNVFHQMIGASLSVGAYEFCVAVKILLQVKIEEDKIQEKYFYGHHILLKLHQEFMHNMQAYN